ncbi:MAG: NAD(P)H-dependent flavin oxidoreductase [Dethiobacteria bacterium]|jgi:NAD(P)H-dependent flavin oxidoreductase YrpB (nitropropane dioxygenase family)
MGNLFKTRVTELLGIKYPLIQGGMFRLSRAELTAAVSNAGGLGILSAATFPEKEQLRAEIRKTQKLTSKPFGVNIPLFPALKPLDIEGVIKVLAEEGVRVAETAGRSPEEYMPLFKEKGILVMHKVTAVRFARKAEKIGCDMVIIDGFECAGHPGEEDVSSLVLLPITVDAVSIPVIAAGGFADGRGLVAALALGAEGVLMGTRFMVSQESPMHQNVKEHLRGLAETETILVLRSLRNSARVIKNTVAEQVVTLESKGATFEELLPLVSGARGKELQETGDVERGLLHCGQVVGLVKDILPVGEIIANIVAEAKVVMERLGGKVG